MSTTVPSLPDPDRASVADTALLAAGVTPPSSGSGQVPPVTAGSPPRRSRPWLTYGILGAAFLTSVTALGASWRRHHASARDPLGARHGGTVQPATTTDTPLSGGAGVVTSDPAKKQAAAVVTRPRVELVFALDTTGSMGGLIEGAKRKIWSLASFVAQGQPTPDLRVGLVAYRDVGDAYVTRVYDLDGDLDRVFRHLSAFRADGGGDGPEHVARALDESVHKISWSKGQEVVKVVYLVGDAPPHTDYHDGYTVEGASRAAANAGIVVHTIQCGDDRETAQTWRTVAALGHGDFMAIHQDGGMHEEHSRYDEELARLHDRLAKTTIAYGANRDEVEAANQAALAAPASIRAARAGFMSSNHKAVSGNGDLVESVGNGTVELEKVQAELPSALRALPLAEQKAQIAAQQKERAAVSQRIDELARLRRTDLDAQEREVAKGGGADGFDVAAKKALRRSVKANRSAAFEL